MVWPPPPRCSVLKHGAIISDDGGSDKRGRCAAAKAARKCAKEGTARYPGSALQRMVEVLVMTEKSNSFAWPNGARIAVAVTCLLENWSGDKGPPFSVQTTSLKPGTHDRAAMTWGTYGSRNGVWRLLKILNENQMPASLRAIGFTHCQARWDYLSARAG